MPTISMFYGVLIQMFWQDHAPPHFHALYGEYEVLINIRTLALVLEWAQEHRTELMENWELCTHNQSLKKIHPLP